MCGSHMTWVLRESGVEKAVSEEMGDPARNDDGLRNQNKS